MDACYWDSSAILKFYVAEDDSAEYKHLMGNRPEAEEICVGFLHETELYYAFQKKELDGQLDVGMAKELFGLFQSHIDNHKLQYIPWSRRVAEESRKVLDTCLSVTPPPLVRSLDGLHLATMQSEGIRKLATADKRMKEAGELLGFEVLSPA